MEEQKIIIRKATHDDCKELAILKKEIWETTYRGIYPDEKIDNFDFMKCESEFKYFIDSPTQELYVVCNNQNLIGFIAFGETYRPYKNYKQELILLYLKQGYQGQGIGRRMFNLAYDYIKNTGETKFFASCNKYNYNAQKFYEKMGATIIDIAKDSETPNGMHQIKYGYIIE